MDSTKRGMLRITSIFLVIEGVLMYYVVGLLLSSTPPINFSRFPGLEYVIKVFYPDYLYVNTNPFWPGYALTSQQAGAIRNQVLGAEHFLLAFWVALIAVAVITVVVYVIKLKELSPSEPKDQKAQ